MKWDPKNTTLYSTNLKEGDNILLQVKRPDEVCQGRIYPATSTRNGDIDITENVQVATKHERYGNGFLRLTYLDIIRRPIGVSVPIFVCNNFIYLYHNNTWSIISRRGWGEASGETIMLSCSLIILFNPNNFFFLN